MTREELLSVAETLTLGGLGEKKEKQYIALLEDNVPHPAAMDLIYWPPGNKELTPVQIVDIALNYDRRENRKVSCNQKMNELIASLGGAAEPDIKFGENTFDGKREFDYRSEWERPDKVKTENIIGKNKVKLNKRLSFAGMYAAVLGLEEVMIRKYPNINVMTYFIYKEDESYFTFHTCSEGEDWMFEKQVSSGNDNVPDFAFFCDFMRKRPVSFGDGCAIRKSVF